MARSRSALLTLAAIAALAGCCVCAPQGSVQGGVQGGAQVPPGVPHSTAPPAGVGGIQSIFQRERISRLAHAWRPHAHQLTLAQSAAAGNTQAARKRRGVHNTSVADRFRDRGGGVLAVGQLLVAGAGGRASGRVTRGGGRVHARVAPAVRGRGQPVGRGLAVARAAAAGAAAGPRARPAARRDPPVPRWLSHPALRHQEAASRFLTGVYAPLLSAARKD